MPDKLERVDIREDFHDEYVEVRYYRSLSIDGSVSYYAHVIFGSGDSFIIDDADIDSVAAKVERILPVSYYVRQMGNHT